MVVTCFLVAAGLLQLCLSRDEPWCPPPGFPKAAPVAGAGHIQLLGLQLRLPNERSGWRYTRTHLLLQKCWQLSNPRPSVHAVQVGHKSAGGA